MEHFEGLLSKEGIRRIETIGQAFDPAIMSAVAAEVNAERPHHAVIEEFAAGYFRRGELLRPAQVKVIINKSGN